MVWFQILAFHFTILSVRSMVLEKRAADFSLAASYLNKYGYVKQSTSTESSSLINLQTAIKDFQVFAGLPATGQLDEETVTLMNTPRCGVKDKVDEDIEDADPELGVIRIRTKRYALQGSRWRVKDLTYKISKYPVSGRLSKNDVDRTMRQAFDVWERVTDLKFEEKKSGKVHIDIRFERRSHGDDDSFDGEGGTLAHAFFPVFGGDVHFDEEENWTVDTPKGTSLLMSAAHELGHSIGLSHSNDRRALMAPFYRGYEKDVSLARDDIEGIEALYGEKDDSRRRDESSDNDITPRRSETPRPTTSAPEPSFDNRELCNGGRVDVMVTLKNDTTYAFRGDKYWKLTETSVASGYPRSISRDWEGLPGNLDAAFTWTNGRTYFFKGSKYWRFTNGRLDSGYPKDMASGFGGIPTNVDAAFVWPMNDKIYFFKGTKYWKFDPEAQPPVDDSYPREIRNWEGIPNFIDAALQYSNGKVYFFKKGQYYRWNDDTFSLDEANPAFPRDSGYWWFGCKNSSPLRRQG